MNEIQKIGQAIDAKADELSEKLDAQKSTVDGIVTSYTAEKLAELTDEVTSKYSDNDPVHLDNEYYLTYIAELASKKAAALGAEGVANEATVNGLYKILLDTDASFESINTTLNSDHQTAMSNFEIAFGSKAEFEAELIGVVSGGDGAYDAYFYLIDNADGQKSLIVKFNEDTVVGRLSVNLGGSFQYYSAAQQAGLGDYTFGFDQFQPWIDQSNYDEGVIGMHFNSQQKTFLGGVYYDMGWINMGSAEDGYTSTDVTSTSVHETRDGDAYDSISISTSAPAA